MTQSKLSNISIDWHCLLCNSKGETKEFELVPKTFAGLITKCCLCPHCHQGEFIVTPDEILDMDWFWNIHPGMKERIKKRKKELKLDSSPIISNTP